MSQQSALDEYAQPYLDMGYPPAEAMDCARADLLASLRPEGLEPPTGVSQETSEHVIYKHSTAPQPGERIVIKVNQ